MILLITLEHHISITNQPANTITGTIMWPGSPFFSDYVPTAALCHFWFHFFFFFFFCISTPTYGMSQQSLHEWVGTDSMKGGGGNGRKNCSFHFPWHAISILYPQLSKSYLKHINFIFLDWMGPQRITSRHRASILGLKRTDENDNSVRLACSIGLLILLLVKKRRGGKSHLKRHCPQQRKILYIEVTDDASTG